MDLNKLYKNENQDRNTAIMQSAKQPLKCYSLA